MICHWMISSPRPKAREAEVVVEDRSVVEEEVVEVAVPDVEEDSEAAVEAQVWFTQWLHIPHAFTRRVRKNAIKIENGSNLMGKFKVIGESWYFGSSLLKNIDKVILSRSDRFIM